jgi:Rieske Fe-S protein
MNPNPDNSPLEPGISRRAVLGLTAAGAAGLLTAACGGSSAETAAADPTSAGSSPSSPSPSSAAPGAASGGIVGTADVPVGGGVFVKDGKIIPNPSPDEKQVTVVTQPVAGTFQAFDATCTHQFCTVGTIANGTITCNCHGSQYSAKDGSVTKGPAVKALAAIAVKVEGDQVVEA